jgi:hypothetical protein
VLNIWLSRQQLDLPPISSTPCSARTRAWPCPAPCCTWARKAAAAGHNDGPASLGAIDNMKTCFIAALLGAAFVLPAAAQTITNVTVEPSTAKVGEAVTITANFDDAANPNCNARVHFGDGASHDFKINQLKDVPLVTRRTYAKPGSYSVRVEGKTALPTLKCVGKTVSAQLKVEAPPPPPPPPPVAAAPAAAAPGNPSCPDGWTLMAKSVSKKTGAFTCSAKAGTKLPMARMDCPGALSYFENKTKAQLGCKP